MSKNNGCLDTLIISIGMSILPKKNVLKKKKESA